MTDRYGRKAMYLLDLICFVVCALCAAYAWNPLSLIVFRYLLALGIGAHHPISATLVAEFSSSKTRGARHRHSVARRLRHLGHFGAEPHDR